MADFQQDSMQSVGNKDANNTRRRGGRVRASCAECRRSKVRCDKNVPCGRCVARGCSSVCPDGALAHGKGNRFILANTEELHERIEQLCVRNRELERALQTLQESVSTEPHPLLPSTSATGILDNLHNEPYTEEDCLADAFGTLTIERDGNSSFVGKTARGEYFIQAPESQSTIHPFRSRDNLHEGLGQEIFNMLPPLKEAIYLCEIYQEYGKFLCPPIPPEDLFDDILERVYSAPSFSALQCYHSLALLLMIFAIGILHDPDRQAYSADAQQYFDLACTALDFNPRTTRLSVEVFGHIAQYLVYSDSPVNADSAWIYIGHSIRLGHSIGLHLDSTRWKLCEKEVQLRRRLFWQLFFMDTWISFCFGRPPIMSHTFIDCSYPLDEDETVDADGHKNMGYHNWTLQYTVLLHSITGAAFGAKSSSYPVIISLDRKVRDFPVPSHLELVWDIAEGSTPVAPYLEMQRWFVLSRKEITLLNLHRVYFARALQQKPTDLQGHQYITSVLTIYRSAWRIIEALKITWRRVPQILSRLCLSWSHGLSAAIVMCLLVTRAPTSNMAPSAVAELEVLLKVFQEAAPGSRGAASLLDSIHNLHRRAREALDNVPVLHTATTLTASDLDRLNGKTHLLSDADIPHSAKHITPEESLVPQNMQGGIHPAQVSSDGNMFNVFPDMNTGSVRPITAQATSFDTGLPTSNGLFPDPATTVPVALPPAPYLYGSLAAANIEMGQPGENDWDKSQPILEAMWRGFLDQLEF